MIFWSHNDFLSRHAVPSMNSLLKTSKIRLLHFTR